MWSMLYCLLSFFLYLAKCEVLIQSYDVKISEIMHFLKSFDS